MPKERRRRRAEKRSSKRVFWRVRFFSSHLSFSGVFRANLSGAEKKTDSPKTPFWTTVSRTTPSPLLWRALIIGALQNSTWNYNNHETTTFECPSSTHRGPKVATTVKRRLLHLAIFERQKTALTTTAKLQQLRVNNREMTTFAESCNDREMQWPWNDKLETAQLRQNMRQILRSFVAVVVSSAFWKSLNNRLFLGMLMVVDFSNTIAIEKGGVCHTHGWCFYYPPLFFYYYVINSEQLLQCNCNVILILTNSRKLL